MQSEEPRDEFEPADEDWGHFQLWAIFNSTSMDRMPKKNQISVHILFHFEYMLFI